jgi:hypothetical protein
MNLRELAQQDLCSQCCWKNVISETQILCPFPTCKYKYTGTVEEAGFTIATFINRDTGQKVIYKRLIK